MSPPRITLDTEEAAAVWQLIHDHPAIPGSLVPVVARVQAKLEADDAREVVTIPSWTSWTAGPPLTGELQGDD